MVTLTNEETATLTQADVIAAVTAFLNGQGANIGSNFVLALNTNTLADSDGTVLAMTATWTPPT
jgi:hypothetical protein